MKTVLLWLIWLFVSSKRACLLEVSVNFIVKVVYVECQNRRNGFWNERINVTTDRCAFMWIYELGVKSVADVVSIFWVICAVFTRKLWIPPAVMASGRATYDRCRRRIPLPASSPIQDTQDPVFRFWKV